MSRSMLRLIPALLAVLPAISAQEDAYHSFQSVGARVTRLTTELMTLATGLASSYPECQQIR